MKAILMLLLTSACYAQLPDAFIKPDAGELQEIIINPVQSDRMPVVRPNASFYRLKTDPKNVLRATTDNMPVKRPDSSTHYTMMHSSGAPYRYEMKPFTRPALPKPDRHIPPKR